MAMPVMMTMMRPVMQPPCMSIDTMIGMIEDDIDS